jgi:hypothetical protein
MEYKINFEVRFNRDDKKHGEELYNKIKLLKQFASSHPLYGEIDKIVLFPVERVGKSGSEVYYLNLHLGRKKTPVRYVAKFQEASMTYSEYVNSVNANLHNICREKPFSSHTKEPADEHRQDEGIIVYRFAKLNHAKAIEFRSVYKDKSVSDDDCCKIIENLYQRQLPSPIDLRMKSPIPFVESYDWYCKKRSADPLGKLDRIALENSEIGKIARKLHDFQSMLQTIEKYKEIKVYSFLQHGDLHARNILVDSSDYQVLPEIIDFGWTTPGHCSRDFVVLEATIKYMLTNEFVANKGNGLKVAHVSPIAYLSLENFLCRKGLDLTENHHGLFGSNEVKLTESEKVAIKRAYKCIVVIRREAKKFLDSAVNSSIEKRDWFTPDLEYFVALFLVSIGLIAFNEADDYWIMRGCDIIADTIRKKESR